MSLPEKLQIKLSIVIAAWNGVKMLRECVSSLANQIEAANAEIIIVSNFADGIDTLKSDFLLTNFIVLPSETTVPQLRAAGILKAKGEIIALSEDICTFDNLWCQEIIKAHEMKHSIVGGAIENIDEQNSLDWAVYFYDYGKYMLPDRARTIDSLSGMNVSYKREILGQIKGNYVDGFYETFINADLKKTGFELFLMPSAIVFHQKHYQFRKISLQLYNQAREFAASRVSCKTILNKSLYILGSLFLPILLPFRIIMQTVHKKNHLKKLFISLPQLIILISVWSFGEFCGYVLGEGHSSKEWK